MSSAERAGARDGRGEAYEAWLESGLAYADVTRADVEELAELVSAELSRAGELSDLAPAAATYEAAASGGMEGAALLVVVPSCRQARAVVTFRGFAAPEVAAWLSPEAARAVSRALADWALTMRDVAEAISQAAAGEHGEGVEP